jgi:glucosamine--fructose-6-phosphate aminotransferase (isomerizing)
MHAGPEIGVASTKAFTASLVDEYLLGVYLGQLRGTLDPARAKALRSSSPAKRLSETPRRS